jgi:hypothetical protein
MARFEKHRLKTTCCRSTKVDIVLSEQEKKRPALKICRRALA